MPKIFQVVGYQDSGKTTIMEKMIKRAAGHGLKVVTIKHHGHGGKPANISGKDSFKHMKAGASASIVEGEGTLILHAENLDVNLDKQIELAEFLQADLVLIEGYKSAPYPKLLLLRSQDDLSLVQNVVNISAIMVWEEGLKPFLKGWPCFSVQDEEAINWMVDTILLK